MKPKNAFTPLVAALSMGLFASTAQAVTCKAGFTASNPDSSYIDNGDGTVMHTPTGLTWKRCAEGQTWDSTTSSCTGTATIFNWSDALTQAVASNYAGKGDWRLPNVKELTSLVEECRSNPTINDAIFPNTATDPGPHANGAVWSSSPYTGAASYVWVVSFIDGVSLGNGLSRDTLTYGVRLVRGGRASFLTAQTLKFGPAPRLQMDGTAKLDIAMMGSSNEPLVFSSITPSICTVTSRRVVTGLAQGTCTIAMNQAGDYVKYSAAAQVTQDITVGPGGPLYANVSSYATTECVKDTQTNLIWEGKTASGDRAGTNTYTNYDDATKPQFFDTTSYTYENTPIAKINGATNSIGYMNTVNASNLCGFSDWRMPTVDELKGLVKAGSSPTIDTTWFPNTPASYVWSNSADTRANDAYFVDFDLGVFTSLGRSQRFGVRLVRVGQSSAPSLAAQVVTFGTAPSLQMGGTATVSATGGTSGQPVVFSSSTTSVCTVNSSTGVVTPVAQGTCTIAANQAGDSSYSAAAQVTQDITVGAAAATAQSALAVVVTGGSNTVAYHGTLTLGSTGGSGTGVVTYASNNANCTISGNTLTGAAAGSCVVTATKAADANYALATATINLTVAPSLPSPPPASVTSTDTPPVTPTIPTNGNVGNSASSGGDILTVGNATLKAGNNGAQIKGTNVAGITTVVVSSGSVEIPCASASNFCQSGKTTLSVLAGESVQFTADGKISGIQINPATPNSTISRLNGKSLIDGVMETIQTKVSLLGGETGRSANDWNKLGLGFSIGQLSVAAQLPMQVNPTLPDGVSLLPNGTVQVVTQGVVVNLAPSLMDTARFTAALQTRLPNAQLRSGNDGTIVISHEHSLYSVCPGLLTVNPDDSEFTVGNDGVLRFGNQTITPAAYSFAQFSTMLADLDAKAHIAVKTDGTLELVLQGMRYTLSPGHQVSSTSTPMEPGFTVRDGKLIVNYPFGFTQEFNVKVGQ